MAKKAQPVGVKTGGRAVLFKTGAYDAEVAPSRVGVETPRHDAARMIVCSEDEGLFLRTGPPLVRRGIVLIEFSDGRALPASARFGAGRSLCDKIWVMLPDIIGDAGAGPLELKATFQLLGDEGVVERLGNRKNLFKKSGDRLWPCLFMVAARGFGLESLFVF